MSLSRRRVLAVWKRMTGLAASILILIFGVGASAPAQEVAAAGGLEISAAARVKNVRIEAQGIASLFSRLSLNYDIPIGLEVAAGEDELAPYQLDLKEGTL